LELPSFGSRLLAASTVAYMLDMQVGALPVRRTRTGKIRILLVTARNKDRWLIPKGARSRKLSHREAAAREAREEGGVHGKIGKRLGSYTHTKAGRDAAIIEVFMLKVRKTSKLWVEEEFRKRKWVSPAKALEMVSEKDLRQIIAMLGA
jgi:8-oxo-dGTP pyrophosphatase MutT (NUDIX family)